MAPRRKPSATKAKTAPLPPPPVTTLSPVSSLPYNLRPQDIPDGLNEAQLELYLFHMDWPREWGGLDAFGHLKRFCRLTWPGIEWNPWMDMGLASLCDREHEHRLSKFNRVRHIAWTGCGGAGKTFMSAMFALSWWLVDPFDSVVTLTSTTKDIIGQRIWPVVQKLVDEAPGYVGHLMNSRKMLQSKQGDEKHSVCAVAVESGEIQRALDRIKGRHATRMMLIVDEANTTPNAIFECITNMAKGAQELVVLVIGNAESRLDNHGRCCEPLDGWSSVTVESTTWRTAGVKEWGLPTGYCCHFDGDKSPNVRAARTIYPYIYTWENHLADAKWGRESARYWSQTRGFWPPDGTLSTVFSESMLDRFDARGRFAFVSRRLPCAFMDTAFGGDRCRIQYGEIGDLHDGRLALQLTDYEDVHISVRMKHEVDYQVAHAFIAGCKKRGVAPEHAGLDATGTGRGVAAIVMSEWSDSVHYIEWGGKASELPASSEDPRPGSEVYHNRVAELWYSCRELLYAGLLKGFNRDAIVEFTQRLFEVKGRRIALETKEDMRERIRHSPDAADATAGLCEIARRHGVGAGSMPRPDDFATPETDEALAYAHPSMQPLDTEIVATSEMDW